MNKFIRNDKVIVISGKDKGKLSKILKVFPENDKLIVEGVNIATKHVKPKNKMENGQIIQKELPIHLSNVSHIDPKFNKPTKIAFKILEDGKKVRVAKKSGEIITVQKD